MKESWRPIEGHYGYYVSDLGRIKSIKRKVEIIKKLQKSRSGIMTVLLFDKNENKIETLYVPRIVLEAFKGFPADPWLCVANHKNGNQEDCRLENLEWLVCETTDEYDPSVSHRRGVLKPEQTKSRMTEAKKKQSQETIRKIIESRTRTLEKRKQEKEEIKNSKTFKQLKNRLFDKILILNKFNGNK